MDEGPRWEPGRSVADDRRREGEGFTHQQVQTLLLAIIALAVVAAAVLIYTQD